MKYNEGSAAAAAAPAPTQRSLTTEEQEWLTTKEAALYLRISTARLRNLTSSGKVPYYKFGRSNRYLRGELRGLLLANVRGGRYGH